MKYDVFVSYSRDDLPVVESIVKDIEQQAGVKCWVDWNGIESGTQFEEVIIKVIDSVDIVLFFISQKSISSQYARMEVNYAYNTKKKVVPVVLDGGTLREWFLFKFGSIDYIDINQKRQYDKLIKNLSVWTNNSKSSTTIDTSQPSELEDIEKSSLQDQVGHITEVKYKSNNYLERIIEVIQHEKQILYQYKSEVKTTIVSQISIIRSLTNTEKCRYIANRVFQVLKLKKFWVITLAMLFVYMLFDNRIYDGNHVVETIIPALRGNILAHDGRVLVGSEVGYFLDLDCRVWIGDDNEGTANGAASNWLKELYHKAKKICIEKGIAKPSIAADSLWIKEAKELSHALSGVLCEKTPEEYYKTFYNARYVDGSNRIVPICKRVEQAIYDTISKMPLLRRGMKGGLLVYKGFIRHRPYGDLALRTLGYVKQSSQIGLEGAYDSILHEQYGIEKTTFFRLFGVWSQVRSVMQIPAKDGKDVHTTLAIPIQKAVDEVLRANISKDSMIYGGAVTIIDVKTGAIRAMSNIVRSQNDNTLGEYYNLAVGYGFEPGSVLGGVTLASYLGRNYMALDTLMLSTSIGKILPTFAINKFKQLEYATYPENYKFCHKQIFETKDNNMTILDGVCQSNSYVLASLALQDYNRLPTYVKTLEDLGLTENFNFDIMGIVEPSIAIPYATDDYNYFLATLGCGYGIRLSQLHILTFYNMIANNGIRVTPYLVELSDKSKYDPNQPANQILDKNSVDVLKKVMRKTVLSRNSGITGKAKDGIAGIAGHGLQYFDGGYITAEGERRWNSTFVGYFPVDNPKYSIICTLVTYKTKNVYSGNGLPSKIVSEIYEKIK